MRTISKTWLLLALVGCGSAKSDPVTPFVGTWSGNIVTASVTCSNGTQTSSTTSTTTVSLAETSGDELAWNADCGEILLTVSGNTASQVGSINCTPVVANGDTEDQNVADGILALNGQSLQVSFTSLLTIVASSGNITCNVPISGSLVRH